MKNDRVRKIVEEEYKPEEVYIFNLTPHTINIVVEDFNTITFEPEPENARVSTNSTKVESIGDIPIYHTEYGEVTGLPPYQKGKSYIVSRLVASACPDRKDLYFPSGLVRDAEGKIIGCKGLEQV